MGEGVKTIPTTFLEYEVMKSKQKRHEREGRVYPREWGGEKNRGNKKKEGGCCQSYIRKVGPFSTIAIQGKREGVKKGGISGPSP